MDRTRQGRQGRDGASDAPLAEVEVSVRALVDVLNLDERGVLVLVDLAALVAKDATLAVKGARLSLGLHLCGQVHQGKVSREKKAERQQHSSEASGARALAGSGGSIMLGVGQPDMHDADVTRRGRQGQAQRRAAGTERIKSAGKADPQAVCPQPWPRIQQKA